MPPASTIEVVSYSSKVVEESKWVEGHYYTDCDWSPGPCIPINVHEEYEPGHWTSEITREELTYKYNGKTYTISERNSSKERLLEQARKEVEKMIQGYERAKERRAHPEKYAQGSRTSSPSYDNSYTTDRHGVRHYSDGHKQYPSSWDEGDYYRYQRQKIYDSMIEG